MEVQAHRELAALEETMTRAVEGKRSGKRKWGLQERLEGQRILLWSDSVAAVAYINKGAGRSDVMSRQMRRIWALCLEMGCSVFAEHVAGALLVAAGVDALSELARLGLNDHLSAQRSNGVRAMVERIHIVAEAPNAQAD